MAQIYSFDLDKGTDWSLNCEYKTNNGSAINISGGTFAGKIRQGSYTGSVVGTFTFSITDAVNGYFRVSLSNVETSALPTGNNYYDIELLLDSKKIRMFEGVINCRAEVTY